MRRGECMTMAAAVVLIAAIALVLPAAAAAAGIVQIGAFQNNPPTYTPVPGALVGLHENSPLGWTEVDRDITAASGYTPHLAAPDIGFGDYVVRVVRPGYVTWDTYPTTYRVPPTTGINAHMELDPLRTERLSDSDRYSTAVKIARERFTSPSNPTLWLGVDTVVIASGEDRAAADPLAAAGLCGAYGETPLFLVSSARVPASVKTALREISQTRGKTRVIVVGGPTSIPNERLGEVISAMPNGVTIDRLIDTGDRFDLAAAIAERISNVKGVAPDMALVANGADPDKFFDALALSTVAAAQGAPILLVNEDSIPSATRNALGQLVGSRDIIIGGGPATVSEPVMAELGHQYGNAERWAGSDRYRTAQAIADRATGYGMLSDDLVGVAARLPDALAGGAMVGQTRGVLLVSDGEDLTPSTGNWLGAHKTSVEKCYVIGGEKSVTPRVKSAINAKLQ